MDPSDNGITQAMRYKDVPTALSYTLIHLSGDYPLLDYTLTGKFICFLMCLFAASVVQVSPPSRPPLPAPRLAVRPRGRVPRGARRGLQRLTAPGMLVAGAGLGTGEAGGLARPRAALVAFNRQSLQPHGVVGAGLLQTIKV